MRHIPRLVIALVVVWIGIAFWQSRPIRHEPGVLVSNDPWQEEMTPQDVGEVAGFRLTAVAAYRISGRVLGTKRYFSGEAAKLVPKDVALGWGKMSDQAVLDRLNLSMGSRFFFYEWQGTPPIAPAEIKNHASNNHVIAADRTVTRAISRLRRGEIVELEGWLVNAVGRGGFRWPTSLRRDDTGNGACELFYVRTVRTSASNSPDAAPQGDVAAVR
ncbi:MAG: hypothetical protein ABI680_11415 [Chthoniobacteraceae bacterium]